MAVGVGVGVGVGDGVSVGVEVIMGVGVGGGVTGAQDANSIRRMQIAGCRLFGVQILRDIVV